MKDQRFRPVSLSGLVSWFSSHSRASASSAWSDPTKKRKINPGKVRSAGRIRKKAGRLNRKIYCVSHAINRLMRRTRDRIGRVKCFLSNYLRPLTLLDNNSARIFPRSNEYVPRCNVFLEIFHLPWWNNLATNVTKTRHWDPKRLHEVKKEKCLRI